MIGFTLLGGYLGAGKTTLLNRILQQNQARAESRRIALLINDFGDINIDAQLIESQSENQINLANGCVCCSLSDGFFEAIDRLEQMSPPPDHIVVEASGVADVYNLSQYGQGNNLRQCGVIVVADAETVAARARDKYVAKTVQRQLQAADLIVLNKTDLVSDRALTELEQWLARLTGDTPVLPTQHCDVPLELIFDLEPEPRHQAATGHHAHESYTQWSFTTREPRSLEQLEAFLGGLDASVLRAKGLFETKTGTTLELQVVGKRKALHKRTIPATGGQLVVIGLQSHLDPASLDRLAAIWLERDVEEPCS